MTIPIMIIKAFPLYYCTTDFLTLRCRTVKKDLTKLPLIVKLLIVVGISKRLCSVGRRGCKFVGKRPLLRLPVQFAPAILGFWWVFIVEVIIDIGPVVLGSPSTFLEKPLGPE
jgi:hypothetical protein